MLLPRPDGALLLIVEDDPDDRLMMTEVLHESSLATDFRFLEDGDQAMDYLHQRGEFAGPLASPRPSLILLDLNMPRKDGREVLQEIKTHPELRCIPVVILTTSRAEEDMLRSYELGANSYITKPTSFEHLEELMRIVHRYWLEIVSLPPATT